MGRISGVAAASDRRRLLWVLLLPWLAVPTTARVDCILDVTTNSDPAFSGTTLFPNWLRAPAGAFTIVECDDVWCFWGTNLPIVGITIMNYGTASGGPAGDLQGLYFQIMCGKTDSGPITMTYAGNWVVAGSPYPAWTWAGSIPWGDDPCTGCLCLVNLFVYADVGPCPVNGATVQLGPGFNAALNPAWPGGIYDAGGCAGPWGQISDPAIRTIRYVLKQADRTVAAPGDTVTYTIYYGRPGTAMLNALWVTDTLPAFTHILAFGPVAPDPGWDPDPGPPLRVRWTLPGPLAPAGGPTAAVSFSATVDWGNGEAFEPGSGDVAATEGNFLFNSAHLAWDPGGGAGACTPGRSSNQVSTVVRRYLFWVLGDNDVLFAPRPGMPEDEIFYEVFVKNVSTQKTWWDVSVWDTVPALIDPWGAGAGFEDPCVGWTMTPTGCAAASPGRVPSGAETILTWRFDLPPAATLAVRWKGRVRLGAKDGDVVTNRASLLARGRTGVMGGTGHASVSRVFLHEAPVVLRTTFVSYVGWAGDDSAFFNCNATDFTYWISFYPLNKACDFALYRRWCCGAAPCETSCSAFALAGGVSPKIDIYAGSCTGGPAADWEMGCMAERSPARFIPAAMADMFVPSQPHHFLHKMVSNSPLLWELSTCGPKNSADADTYVGATSLTFCGFILYTWLRNMGDTYLDSLFLVDTDDATPTTAFAFKWNYWARAWDFYAAEDIYQGSQWAFAPPAADLPGHFRVVSSAARLIVHKAFVGLSAGGAYNDMGTLAPNRENGNLVNASIPATFYLYAGHLPGASDVAIMGNMGAKAAYQVWQYAPFDTAAPNPYPQNVSLDLVGNAGSWILLATDTVDAAAPLPGPTGANPHVYGDAYDQSTFAVRYRLYKVRVQSGGPVQAYCGRSILDRYSGGSMLHAAVPAGQQTGTEFWLHMDEPDHIVSGCGAIMTLNAFSPKVNLGVNLVSSDGASATYTTNDTDECVSYRAITSPAKGALRIWRMQVTAGGNPGDVVAQYIACNLAEKFYTAPFLQRGVFYAILTPPVAYSGQDFWLTVVVVQSGTTKVDYCGTSSFTSTDPAARIEGSPMDSFNFTWSSSTACSTAPNENGVKVFVNVRFNGLGLQSIVASDIADGSITGLATIMIVGADVRLLKEPQFSVQASGDTVRFKICWSNYSSGSAFGMVMTDAVPVGTTFLPEGSTAAFDCGSTDGVTVTTAYSTATTATMPGAAAFTGGNPASGTRWLRWTVPVAGVETSGCACFRTRVD